MIISEASKLDRATQSAAVRGKVVSLLRADFASRLARALVRVSTSVLGFGDNTPVTVRDRETIGRLGPRGRFKTNGIFQSIHFAVGRFHGQIKSV